MTLFVVVVLVVAGGAVAATAAYFESRPGPNSVGITDDAGRTVAVPIDHARVASLAPSITDSLFRLGLRSHIVAVDCYAPAFGGLSEDYDPAQISEWDLSSSMCVQTGPSLNIEELLNATPQLVLVATTTSESAVDELTTNYHLPVLVLQPATLGGIGYDVQLLAQIFPAKSAAASALEGQIQVEIERATSLATNLSDHQSPLPSVLITYETDSNGYWTFGPGSFGQSLIEVASAVNVASDTSFEYPELSGSQVLVDNPWGVIYATGFGLNLTSYAQAPDWGSLNSTSNGHLWGMDSTLLTEPDPTMILVGLPLLISYLHPDGT
ncbi:MAG: ABC transporter substrate-binding protein [Thermoplasmata archaeon]